MKHLILLFTLALVPAIAHAESDCETIRNKPAKLITIKEWDKMMACDKEKAPKAGDLVPDSDLTPEQIAAAKAPSEASLDEQAKAFDRGQAAITQAINANAADRSALWSAQNPPLTVIQVNP